MNKCKQCNKEFIPKNIRATLCSQECRLLWNNEKELKQCFSCGSYFEGNKSNKYCGYICAAGAQMYGNKYGIHLNTIVPNELFYAEVALLAFQRLKNCGQTMKQRKNND